LAALFDELEAGGVDRVLQLRVAADVVFEGGGWEVERVGDVGEAEALPDRVAEGVLELVVRLGVGGHQRKLARRRGGVERRELARAQLFCEIELGQILGPNPGAGAHNWRGLNPDADSRIPAQRVWEFRRYHGWREQLLAIAKIGNARTGGAALSRHTRCRDVAADASQTAAICGQTRPGCGAGGL
jgi:hypothetical protein